MLCWEKKCQASQRPRNILPSINFASINIYKGKLIIIDDGSNISDDSADDRSDDGQISRSIKQALQYRQ